MADRFGAIPFDIDGVFWSHRGPRCTFDTMLKEWGLEEWGLEEWGLDTPALARLALIVRGADTARPELAPEAPGLLAASLGLSRMYRNDLAQLEAGLALYDAFFRWCRDATEETHNWPAATGSAPPSAIGVAPPAATGVAPPAPIGSAPPAATGSAPPAATGSALPAATPTVAPVATAVAGGAAGSA